MKIKLIALMLIIAAMLMFAGCEPSAQNRPNDDVVEINDDCRFEYLGVKEKPYIGEYFYYWRDTTTDIVYIVYRWGTGNGSYGGFTPLLNADGTPVLWSEIKSEMEASK